MVAGTGYKVYLRELRVREIPRKERLLSGLAPLGRD